MISDERREVAAMLRSCIPDRSGMVSTAEVIGAFDVDTIGNRVFFDDALRIADLIDPTTTVDETGVETVADAVHLCECNECGHSFELVYGEYEYCPRCGARVVTAND